MQKLRAIGGYTWAVLTIPIVLATFMGLNFWPKTLVNATGLKVSPWFTGGEVRKTVDHGSYQTLIHRPVFDGLVAQYSSGFVQIDWGPPSALPEQISEDVDLDGDGRPAFHVDLATARCHRHAQPSRSARREPDRGLSAQNVLAIRVKLHNIR